MSKLYEGPQEWNKEDIIKNGTYVAAFLTSSYIYYLNPCMNPICSDYVFDWVCKELLERWDSIEHQHKHLIDIDDLKAGSGFKLKEEDYPTIVKSVAMSMSTGGFVIP